MRIGIIPAVAFALASAAFAQEFRGTITGSVTDPQNSPVPNAKIVAKEQSTGIISESATYLGQSITFNNPHMLNPYSVRWEFGIQQQLSKSTVLEVAYIGNHSLHLPVNQQLNFIPRQYLSTLLTRDNAVNNLLSGKVANPFVGQLSNSTSLNGSTVNLSQLLVPYPQFPVSGVTMAGASIGSSYFHSLNVRLEKRMSNGLSLINNFIWSKMMAKTSRLNDSDPTLYNQISSDHRPLREVLALTYQLPFGSGRRLALPSKWANRLLGDWGLNAIYTWQAGAMLSWGDVIYYGGDLHLNPREVNGKAFDTTQFDTASADQYASHIRTFPSQFSSLRQDASNNVDLSLLKNFRFVEKLRLQLRFEAFNALNHPTFGAPNTSPTSSNFGVITSQANSPRVVQLGGRIIW